jgi:hypothetical protein
LILKEAAEVKAVGNSLGPREDEMLLDNMPELWDPELDPFPCAQAPLWVAQLQLRSLQVGRVSVPTGRAVRTSVQAELQGSRLG